MKRLISSLCAVLLAISTIGQNTFTVGDLIYEITSANTVEVHNWATSAISITIPESIVNTDDRITYRVTAIGEKAFQYNYNLEEVAIPNSITTIGNNAFHNCTKLEEIIIPNSVTSIGNNVFQKCNKLLSITLSNTLTFIGSNAFLDCSSLSSIIIPNSVTSISSQAFNKCNALTSVTLPESATIAINAFDNAGKRDTINGVVYAGNDTMRVGEEYKFTNAGFITFYLADETYHTTEASLEDCVTEKNGQFTIPDSITRNGNTYPVTVIKKNAFSSYTKLTSVILSKEIKSIGNEAFYGCKNLESIICLALTAPKLGSQVFSNTSSNRKLITPFSSDYNFWKSYITWEKTYSLIQENETATLSSDFTITDKIGLINNGVLRIPYGKQLINETENNISGIIEVETDELSNSHWSFLGAPFSNYKLDAIKEGSEDVSVSTFNYTTGNWSNDWATIETPISNAEGFLLWSFAQEPTTFTTDAEGEGENYALNNSNEITVTKDLTTYQEGNWFALANPYTFKLDVSKFITTNKANIQGQNGIYKLDNEGEFQYIIEGEINVTEGFFVNYASEGQQSVIFDKSHRLSKSNQPSQKEYIKLKLQDGERESQLLFSHNDQAKTNYDIFDANKLFSLTEATEPYFLTENIALVKEEVDKLPYIATLNVRSYQTKEVTFKIDDIPQDILVFLFDNGHDVLMNNGVEYTTTIVEGENADRFQLLVKQSCRIEETNDQEIAIRSQNRDVYIETPLDNLQITIFNSLGQEVLSTKEKIFTLNQLPAGAYLIKVFSKIAIKSAKIILK